MGINGIKNTLNIKQADTINKDKMINKGTIINNYGPSKEQMDSLLDVAITQATSKIQERLYTKSLSELKVAFSEISPMFFVTNGTNDHADIQVDVLVSNDVEVALRKQAISAIGMLSKKDILLVEILHDLHITATFLSRAMRNQKGQLFNDKKELVSKEGILKAIENWVNIIKGNIELYISKWGEIKFRDFASIIRQGIATNDEKHIIDFEEIITHSFIAHANDKSKNTEYFNEDWRTRTTSNRSKWNKWFNIHIFPQDIKNALESITVLIQALPMFATYRAQYNKPFQTNWILSDLGRLIGENIHKNKVKV